MFTKETQCSLNIINEFITTAVIFNDNYILFLILFMFTSLTIPNK